MDESRKSVFEKLPWFDWLLVIQIVLIVTIVLVAVFFRYVINQSLSWSDEAARYLFVWLTLLGSAAVLRERGHIRVEYFVELMSTPIQRAFEILSTVLVIGFNLFLLLAGWIWVYKTAGTTTSGLKFPLNWVFYASLPITAMINIYYALKQLFEGPVSPNHTSSEDIEAHELL